MEGTVIRQHLGHYVVANDGVLYLCALSTRLRKTLHYPEASPGSRRRRVQRVRRLRVTDPVAIGDHVDFDVGDGETGMIRKIHERRNKISRRASGSSPREQSLAANIDRVVPIFSLNDPPPDFNLLDRMLAIAEWEDLEAVICINKTDLATTDAIEEAVENYIKIGYSVIRTSTVDDAGREDIHAVLDQGTSLFMGPSGVGKSSLLNWLQPGLKLRTGEVSELTREGRHTTTHLELVTLGTGGLVGDIPGVKEFRLWNIQPEDVPSLYREFVPYLNTCRFRDCAHILEPDCAIKAAVDDGAIFQRRYASYLRLREAP